MFSYFLNHGKSTGFLTSLLLSLVLWIAPGFPNDRYICNEIAHKVEVENNLPNNILRSIAFVEAGRKQRDGSVNPWPWSLNHAGKSLFFENKADALNYLSKNITAEFKNIDVGCMQINVRWHKQHFESLSMMIDPKKNIEYAASFLKSLREAHGSWEDAIKHYHSSTPKLNVKYYAKVKKIWQNKMKSAPILQTAAFLADDKIRDAHKKNKKHWLFNKQTTNNLEGNKDEMLNFFQSGLKNQDNQIYLNAVLLDNNEMYNEDELTRYIQYKSNYLGKKIDMILLFREEFSKK